MVAEPEETVVGTLDEDFAVESMAGDVFLLGHDVVAHPPRRGRARARRGRAAARRRRFRSGAAKRPAARRSCRARCRRCASEIVDAATSPSGRAVDFLVDECGLDRRGAEQAVAYVRAGRALRSARCPRINTVVAERFFDEGGGMQLVLHAPFGARINRAWGLALRKRFCRSFNFELQAAATDNGIVISLSDQHSFPLELVFRFLSKETVEEVLTQAMLPAPMFEVRWRWNASRALAVLRFSGGRKVPPPIQRMRSDDLLAAVFPDQVACQENIVGDIRIPDHPLVNETIEDCLHEAMDLDGLKRLVERIGSGELQDRGDRHARAVAVLARDSQREPVRLSGRRAARRAPRARGADAAHDRAGRRTASRALDPAAIAEVAAESWPVGARCRRTARRAADAGRRAAGARVGGVLRGRCAKSRRATVLSAGGANFWVAAERLKSARLLYPDATIAPADRRLRSHADLRSGVGGHRDAARLARIERAADAERPRPGDSRCPPT